MTDQKQLDNMEYFSCLGRMVTNDARCTREIKSRIAMEKASTNKNTLFARKLDLNLRKYVVKCTFGAYFLCGAETWTLRKVDQKYLESFEMCCWRRMEKVVGPLVKNKVVLYKSQGLKDILCTEK
jgi:hypothetical protein